MDTFLIIEIAICAFTIIMCCVLLKQAENMNKVMKETLTTFTKIFEEARELALELEGEPEDGPPY